MSRTFPCDRWLVAFFDPSGQFLDAVEKDGCYPPERWASNRVAAGETFVCARLTGEPGLDEPRAWHALYHACSLSAMAAPESHTWLNQREQHYRHVAEVAAPALRIFALTNHRERDWVSHPEIRWHLPEKLRSTSVGDVIVSRDTGMAWMFLPIGWLPIPPHNKEALEHAEQ